MLLAADVFELTLHAKALLFALIAIAGTIDSMVGGGGLITVPAYLGAGVPPSLVLGTNKSVSTVGTSLAVYRYVRSGLIHWKMALFIGFFSMIASFIGAGLSTYLNSKHMVAILFIIIPIILGAEVIRTKLLKAHTLDPILDLGLQGLSRGALVGLSIGLYDGAFGPGTGALLIVVLIWLLRYDEKMASANGRLINLCTNVAALVHFAFKGLVIWELTAILVPAALLGNYLGSHMVISGGKRVVRIALYSILSLVLLKCCYDLWL